MIHRKTGTHTRPGFYCSKRYRIALSFLTQFRKRGRIITNISVERYGILKYLPDDLRREYEYLTKNNPDIEGLSPPFINLSDTFRAYFILVHYFTDSSSDDDSEKMMLGIRSVDLLASALGRQIVGYGGHPKYRDPLEICSTLFFGLVKNHSFNDGNKRTALLILLYQLNLYGYMPTAPQKEFEKLVLSVAASKLENDYRSYYRKFKKFDDWQILLIAFCLRRMVAKKDNSYHISPTAKEFCSALENIGVTYSQENGKLRFSYIPKTKWRLFSQDEKNYSIPFGGWTRTIGPKTARETLQALGLYDQFASYKDFLEGAEPLYDLVDTFKEPLRRLKDR